MTGVMINTNLCVICIQAMTGVMINTNFVIRDVLHKRNRTVRRTDPSGKDDVDGQYGYPDMSMF